VAAGHYNLDLGAGTDLVERHTVPVVVGMASGLAGERYMAAGYGLVEDIGLEVDRMIVVDMESDLVEEHHMVVEHNLFVVGGHHMKELGLFQHQRSIP
jgi:hypothetical protein